MPSWTTRTLAALAPRATRYTVNDPDCPGLTLRVSPTGHKVWLVIYRAGGRAARQKWYTLGAFGGDGAIGLAEARKRARALQQVVADGGDPVADKKAAREAATRETFGALAELFIERHAKKTKRTWTEDVRILNKDLLPRWRDVPVRQMTRRDIREHLDVIADRAPIAANRALALISTILNFGVDREWLDSNPAYRLKKPGEERSRERVLTDAELRQLWQALEAAEAAYRAIAEFPRGDGRRSRVTTARLGDDTPLLRPMLADWLRMRLLTAQRGGEVIRMRWQDVTKVDRRRVWTIPADIAKNGRAHAVPLAPTAVTILARRRRAGDRGVPWVFPNDLNRGSAHDRAKKVHLSAFLAGADDVRGHDLRRTAASGLARLGVSRETIAHVLNHVDRGPKSTKVYDRFDRLPEKRAALDRWARDVERIVTGTAPAKVVAIGR